MRASLASLSTLHLVVGLSACGGDDIGTSDPQDFTAFACSSKQVTAGAPRVYFSPWDEAEREALCLLDQAEEEVVVAHYNIRTQSYLDKLVELQKRGVDVKVVVDLANSKKEWNVGDDFLEQSGISLVRTSSKKSALMHLKSTVIDRTWVMTGSFNWNETASLANDENMIVLKEPALAELYATQILQVFDQTTPVVKGGFVNEHYTVHWSPEERLDTILVKRLDAVKSSIDIAMFTLTSDTVAKAVERALERKVKVRVVTELKQAPLSTVDERIEQKGGLVIRAANKVGEFSAMHQKYAILDGSTVITGATNWTNAGTRTNDEDLLILSGLPDVAEAYRRNFADLLWVYAELEPADLPTSSKAGILFQAVNDGTQLGDSMVVVGNRSELGSWDPQRGIPLDTTDTLFPSWSGNVKLPAGVSLEFKFVTIRGDGAIVWEPGPNRMLTIGEDGRSEVYGGTYGDTSDAWTPAGP